jgi:hypothetical protein
MLAFFMQVKVRLWKQAATLDGRSSNVGSVLGRLYMREVNFEAM